MDTDETKRFFIEYKSIFLDIVESYKTYQRVEEALSGGKSILDHSSLSEITKQEKGDLKRRREELINAFPDGLLYKFRKCIRIC